MVHIKTLKNLEKDTLQRDRQEIYTKALFV